MIFVMSEEQVDFDIIDEAVYSLLNELSGEDDEAFEDNAEVLYMTIDQMVDEDLIEDLPDLDSDDAEKSAWIEKYLPIVKNKMLEAKVDDVDTNS
jgi:hypothetical protein